MKFGVVVFPGSNCDDDMVHILSKEMGMEVEKLWHKRTDLDGYTKKDCIVLPGGFSYGDYLRSGAIARFSPIMKQVVKFAEKGGFIIGVCNGFQILCEAGLLPGALLENKTQKFICKNVHLKVENDSTAFTHKTKKGDVLKIPIAHAEGRFYGPSDMIDVLEKNNQVLFRYCDAEGESNDEHNPNGSLNNIAGICNHGRNIFGMMPHPERASEALVGNTDGRVLFESIIENTFEIEGIMH